MNYLDKHNPIGDVDMIRILERLDAGATVAEILDGLPQKNREEARELLDVIVLLDDLRENSVPPRENLQHILAHLDDAFVENIHETLQINTREKKTTSLWARMPRIPSPFTMQKYFFPISALAVVVILFVSSRYFTSQPIGDDAVLFELSTEDPADVFPDDNGIATKDETVQDSADVSTPSLNTLMGEGTVESMTTTESLSSVDQKSALPSGGVSSAPQASRGMMFDENLETTLAPLVKNESSDAYGVFPEDDFSVYLQTLTDIPIDHY